jgi:hypothetical protein
MDVEKIKAELATWRERRAQTEADNVERESRRVLLDEELKSLLLQSYDDATAKQRVNDIEDEQVRLDREAKRSLATLEQINSKISALEAEQADAVRDEALQKYNALSLEILTVDGAALEEGIAQLIIAKERFVERTRKLDRLAISAGVEPRHSACLKNFRRAVDARLNISPVYLEKKWRDFFRSPVGEIFERSLSDQSAEDDIEQKLATN